MILIHYTPEGLKRTADLRNTQWGQTAILVGGAPSLAEQPYPLLEQRGVLTMGINNAARFIRPTYFIGGDNPNCYEPQILRDPTITKFGPLSGSTTKADLHCNGTRFWEFPNMYFYMQKKGVPWDQYLATHAEVPWYHNTLMAAIHVLYQLGVRRIILAGSDFMFGKTSDYAHGQQLDTLEKKWNLDLYNHQVRELRLLKPLFEKSGLQLLDSSKHSRISQVYPKVTLEEAVGMCLEGFPAKPVEPGGLPHCSKYASKHIKDHIAEWPGHQGPVSEPGATPPNPEMKKETDEQDLQLAI